MHITFDDEAFGFLGPSDIEIYAKDSVFVFVRVTVNPNDQNTPFFVEDKIIFETNDNEQSVLLTAYGQNANYIIANQEINQTNLKKTFYQ